MNAPYCARGQHILAFGPFYPIEILCMAHLLTCPELRAECTVHPYATKKYF